MSGDYLNLLHIIIHSVIEGTFVDATSEIHTVAMFL